MDKWPLIRDVSLFFGGLAGVIHETLFTHSDRPTLLVLFAAMMGLPAFLRPSEYQAPHDSQKAQQESALQEKLRQTEEEKKNIIATLKRIQQQNGNPFRKRK